VGAPKPTGTALGIALNRTGELADWDIPALGRLLETLKHEGALVRGALPDSARSTP
jgi:hypothetical protein